MGLSYQAAIDGGTVSFEDGLKAAEEYAPARKVRVELNFSTAEGGQEDAADLVASIGDLAKAEVHRLLAGTAPALVVVGGTDAPAGERQRRTRRTAAQIEADQKASLGGSSGGSPEGSPTQPDKDPAAIVDDPSAITDEIVGSAADDPAEVNDWIIDVDPGVADAEPITDADLNSAVQKKNAELNDPPRIRELIGSYNPDPKSVFQLRQIPAAERAGFLAKLAALTKAA